MHFEEWLSNNWDLLVSAISSLVTLIVLLVTRNSKIANKVKEVVLEIMSKYRTADYLDSSQDLTKVTKGHTLVKQYRYNEQTKEIEPTGEVIDLTEQIQSAYTTSIDMALERMLPSIEMDSSNVALHKLRSKQAELDELTQLINVAEDYRDKYNLSSDLSIQDIYKFVESESEKMKQYIDKAKTSVLKEVKKDEENQTQ